jgi:hypothetical protein
MRWISLCGLIGLIAASCGSDSTATDQFVNCRGSIRITPQSVEVPMKRTAAVSGTLTLTDCSTQTSQALRWTMRDTTVASFAVAGGATSSAGSATGKKLGLTWLVASSLGLPTVRDSIQVEVFPEVTGPARPIGR